MVLSLAKQLPLPAALNFSAYYKPCFQNPDTKATHIKMWLNLRRYFYLGPILR